MPTRLSPEFHGDGRTLFAIYIRHFLLTLVTFGIYTFWAKADLRRYLYSQTSVAGDRFNYSGTGGELIRGWIKAMGLIIVAVIVGLLLSAFVHELVGTLALYAGLGFFVFPLAIIGSRRYRLSRTSWRGIRFSFRGEYDDLLGIFIPGLLLSIVTLGLYYPFFHANVRRFVVGNTHFGRAPFQFTGTGGDLFGRHVLLYVALPLTLGLYWFWHLAYRHRYYWSHTRFGGARFESKMQGEELLSFSLTNVLLLIVTLGIAYPWVQARALRFACERVVIGDLMPFESAVQDAQAADATGEGLTEMFDWDLMGADYFGL